MTTLKKLALLAATHLKSNENLLTNAKIVAARNFFESIINYPNVNDETILIAAKALVETISSWHSFASKLRGQAVFLAEMNNFIKESESYLHASQDERETHLIKRRALILIADIQVLNENKLSILDREALENFTTLVCLPETSDTDVYYSAIFQKNILERNDKHKWFFQPHSHILSYFNRFISDAESTLQTERQLVDETLRRLQAEFESTFSSTKTLIQSMPSAAENNNQQAKEPINEVTHEVLSNAEDNDPDKKMFSDEQTLAASISSPRP